MPSNSWRSRSGRSLQQIEQVLAVDAQRDPPRPRTPNSSAAVPRASHSDPMMLPARARHLAVRSAASVERASPDRIIQSATGADSGKSASPATICRGVGDLPRARRISSTEIRAKTGTRWSARIFSTGCRPSAASCSKSARRAGRLHVARRVRAHPIGERREQAAHQSRVVARAACAAPSASAPGSPPRRPCGSCGASAHPAGPRRNPAPPARRWCAARAPCRGRHPAVEEHVDGVGHGTLLQQHVRRAHAAPDAMRSQSGTARRR